MAVPITDLRATASATQADEFTVRSVDPDLERLLRATAAGYADVRGDVPPVELSASTVIPRSVGLAGSSALIIAALRALAGWNGHRWDSHELAEIALSIERDRMGIAAGLQDRLVQSVDRVVAMTFDPDTYVVLRPEIELPLFVAWSSDAAATSDTVHRSLRRRFDGGDRAVSSAMDELADQAHRARIAIAEGDLPALGSAMDRSFDIRASIIDVGERQRRLVEIGRDHDAWVNSAGSGGSVIGLVPESEALPRLRESYEGIGAEFLEII